MQADNKIEIAVTTTAQDLDESFNLEEPLRVVFQKKAQFGWGDKVELELVPKPVVV